MTKVIVYTSLIGDYDDVPQFEQVDESIDHVLLTDEISDSFDYGPWKPIRIEKYFLSNKITNGFLKAAAHQIFGPDVVSAWVDSNLTRLNLNREDILSFVKDGPVATPAHSVRRSVAEELLAVEELRLEHPSAVARHRMYLAEQGYPDSHRLSATMMLIRDHRNPAMRAANDLWWNIISGGLRRDQLSFDFALWKAGLRAGDIDVDWRVPNRFFVRTDHKNTAGRKYVPGREDEFLKATELNMQGLPATYPANVVLWPESPPVTEISAIRTLNATVVASTPGGIVEGNYCYNHNTALTVYTPVDPRRSWKREYLRHAVLGCTKGVEIGFNAGHSAAIMLAAEPGLVLTSVDINRHACTEPCAAALAALFANRLSFVAGRSDTVLPDIPMDSVDFVHIDGGHDEASVRFDLNWFYTNAKPGCLLVVDDAYVPRISRMLDQALAQGLIVHEVKGMLGSGENALFRRA